MPTVGIILSGALAGLIFASSLRVLGHSRSAMCVAGAVSSILTATVVTALLIVPVVFDQHVPWYAVATGYERFVFGNLMLPILIVVGLLVGFIASFVRLPSNNRWRGP